MENILITGASGFTAQYLAKHLRAIGGYRVFGTSITKAAIDPCFDAIVQCDLRDSASIDDVLVAVNPYRVIHLAGLSFVGHPYPVDFYDVNVLGTENLLGALERKGSSVASVILSSSANIYGTPDRQQISEQERPNPVNHYAISKLSMEYMAHTYGSRLPIIITRPFNYIGYGQNENFVIPKLVKAYAKRAAEIEMGDIDVSRDFSSVHDIVDAYAKLMIAENAVGETFNLCSGKATSLSSIVDLLNQMAGYKMIIKKNPKFIRKNEIRSLCGSNQKLMGSVDWSPTGSVEPIITEIFQEYRSDNLKAMP